MLSPELKALLDERNALGVERVNENLAGVGRTALNVGTFGWGQELEAGVRSAVGESEYAEEYRRIQDAMQDFRSEYGLAATAAELVGSLGVGMKLIGSLGKLGLNPTQVGMIDAGAWGGGEFAPEDGAIFDNQRLAGAAMVAAPAGVVSRLLGGGRVFGDVPLEPPVAKPLEVGDVVTYTNSRNKNRAAEVVDPDLGNGNAVVRIGRTEFAVPIENLSAAPKVSGVVEEAADGPVSNIRWDEGGEVIQGPQMPRSTWQELEPIAGPNRPVETTVTRTEMSAPETGAVGDTLYRPRRWTDEKASAAAAGHKEFSKFTQELADEFNLSADELPITITRSMMDDMEPGELKDLIRSNLREETFSSKESADDWAEKVVELWTKEIKDRNLFGFSGMQQPQHFKRGVVYLNDESKGGQLAQQLTYTHEVGHNLIKRLIHEGHDNPVIRNDILNAYNRTSKRASQTPYDKTVDFGSYSSREARVEEWVVDNIALWATRRWADKPSNRLESWFKVQAAKLRKGFSKLVNFAGKRGMQTLSLGEDMARMGGGVPSGMFNRSAMRTRTAMGAGRGEDGIFNPDDTVSKWISEVAGNRKQRRMQFNDVDETVPTANTTQRYGPGQIKHDMPTEDMVTQGSYRRVYDEFDNARGQNDAVKHWREATNAGELYDGFRKAITDWYDDKLTGVSDRIGRRVSRRMQGLVERADVEALRISNKEFEQFVRPVERIEQLAGESERFKRALMDFGAGQMTRSEMLQVIERELSKEDAQAFSQFMDWVAEKNQQHGFFATGKTFDRTDHLHTNRIKIGGGRPEPDEMNLPVDTANLPLSRDRLSGNYDASEYANPIASTVKRIFNNERMVQYGKKFNLNPKRQGTSMTPNEILKGIEQTMVKGGLREGAAKKGMEWLGDNIRGQSKTPVWWLQALQSGGYMGTLGGPKSAVLNLHDPMQASVSRGVGNMMRGTANARQWNPEKLGLSNQQVGEFNNRLNQELADLTSGGRGAGKEVARGAGKAADATMKASGFQLADSIGKSNVLAGVVEQASDILKRDGFEGLKKEWGFYFSDPELRTMARDLERYGADWKQYSDKARPLIEELAFAGLGQQQLISSVGRPGAWARNPNLRWAWALRGFAIKQQALAYRNIIENLKEGNTGEAARWAARYVALASTGYAGLNEGRQVVFGDGESSVEDFLRSMADQVSGTATLNTLGFNDYQWGKMQRDGVMSAAMSGLAPMVFSYPLGKLGDLVESGGDSEVTDIPYVPAGVRQMQKMGDNASRGMFSTPSSQSGMLGLPPQIALPLGSER